MKDLFGKTSIPETRKQYLKRRRREDYTKTGTLRKNPMLILYGTTDGERCKTCIFLVVRKFAKNYYKCRYRGCSSNPRLDHKVNWPACGRYSFTH